MDKIIEWQLPVSEDMSNGAGYHIHGNAKIHCYLNGNALCSAKNWIVPGKFETSDFGEKDIVDHPKRFCKKCVGKFKKMKELEGRQ